MSTSYEVTASHPYDGECGCNTCEIEGHARDNISDTHEADADCEMFGDEAAAFGLRNLGCK